MEEKQRKIIIARRENNGNNVEFKYSIGESNNTQTIHIDNLVNIYKEFCTKNKDGGFTPLKLTWMPKKYKYYISSKPNEGSEDNIDSLPLF